MSDSSRATRVLAVDVGNTSALFGLFTIKAPKIPLTPTFSFRIETSQLRSPRRLNKIFPRTRFSGRCPSVIMVSSVVPPIDRPLKAFLSRSFHAPVEFISSRRTGDLKIRYKAPKELGADRIVNGRGAMAFAAGAAIVVDFGTATTFDCLSAKQEFLGGVIAPGPLISAEALFQRTAKLPRVQLSRSAPVIGRTTLGAMQSGLYHGYRGMVMEIVRQLKKKLGAKTTLLATGGQAPLILKGLPVKFRYLPFLTLAGLVLLWADGRERKLLPRRAPFFDNLPHQRLLGGFTK